MPSSDSVGFGTVSGIDVSHRQGDVNWHSVAEAGISFAFAKATEGGTFTDPQFNVNWAGMKSAGILRGAYHFFRPARPFEAQVENFVKAVRELKTGDLPPVLDLEEALTPNGDEWETIPIAQRVELVQSWLDAVEARLGRRPIVYTRRGFVTLELPNPAPLSQCSLWIAHYTNKLAPDLPSAWKTWTFWQYSDAGKVDGIVGHVDLDRFNGSQLDLSALTDTGISPSN
jgi:lysozyme